MLKSTKAQSTSSRKSKKQHLTNKHSKPNSKKPIASPVQPLHSIPSRLHQTTSTPTHTRLQPSTSPSPNGLITTSGLISRTTFHRNNNTKRSISSTPRLKKSLQHQQTTTHTTQSFSSSSTTTPAVHLGIDDVYMEPRVEADPSTFARRMMTYWFQDYERGKMVSDACRKKWFMGHPVLDKYMVYEFGADFEAYKHEKLSGGGGVYSEIEKHPLGALSLIILIQQYPKSQLRLAKAENGGFLTPEIVVNSHFGPTARLAHDTFMEMVYNSIQMLHPLRFDVIERIFFFLPLLQVENRITQKVATARLSDLVEEAPRMHKPLLTAVKEFGLAHLDVVQQFSRFPQRNALMGRESTPHELEYLKLYTSDWEPIKIYQFVPDIDYNGDGVQPGQPIHEQNSEYEPQIDPNSFVTTMTDFPHKAQFTPEEELPTRMKNPSAWV